ncbi:MAG: hypothetical protein O2955_14135 [Planctomycetota bacterium]|nr:hypothetical protein [Planctomycetota bacterium]MDA1213651.1 hypothetical protein [Planctomycetota bacterium]
MASEPVDPAADRGETTEVTPDVRSLASTPISSDSSSREMGATQLKEQPLETLDEGDRLLLELQQESAERASRKIHRRQRKSVRLATLWYRIGCSKISQTYRRFPGWMAATCAASLAVVLSLFLLLIHMFWSTELDDQNKDVAIERRLADDKSSVDDLDVTAISGDSWDVDGPSPVVAPLQPSDPDSDSQGSLTKKASSSQLAIEISAYLLAGQPDNDEKFIVSSQEYQLPVDGVADFSDELATVDSRWRTFNSLRNGTQARSNDSNADWPSNDEDDLISVSTNSLSDSDVWREVNGKRSRPVTSDVADALLSSLHETHLTMEPVLQDNSLIESDQGGISGWVITNEGPAEIEMLSIEHKIPEGLTLRQGEWNVDQEFHPSDWKFRKLAARASKTVGFSIYPDRTFDSDGQIQEVEQQRVEAKTHVYIAAAVSAETRVDAPHLKLTWSIPEHIKAGSPFVIDFEVENTGKLPVKEICIEADLGEGLEHRYGRRIVYRVGTMVSGQKYKCHMDLTASSAGDFEQAIRLTGDGNVHQHDDVVFEVGKQSTATGQRPAERL